MSEIALDPSSSPLEDQPSSPEMSEEEFKLHKWLEWKARCDANRIKVQNSYGSCVTEAGARYKPSRPIWEDVTLDESQRREAWVGEEIQAMNAKEMTFSPAAMTIVSSHEHAQFYDDVKWDYLGDSDKLGQFREISPRHNQSPFDVQFDYSKGVLNAYTEAGTVVHVRETLDPAAQTRSQKLFIVAINLMTKEIQRLYADDKPKIESLSHPVGHFNEIMILTPRTLLDAGSDLLVNDDNSLKLPLVQLFANHTTRLQPKLKKSAAGSWDFQVAGHGEFSRLHPIAKLDKERHLLGQIALATDRQLTDRGTILQPFYPSQIAS
ncbi:MAG: hypothetical protein ABWX90_00595 [Candidatus Saccharimonadales bacterium]